MTTVAYDGKILAADQRVSGGGAILPGGMTKIFSPGGKYRNSTIKAIGFCGMASRVKPFIDWVTSDPDEKQMMPIDEESTEVVSAIVVTNAGAWLFQNDRYPIALQSYMAVGSGEEYAKSALYLGKNAVEAVKVAIEHDCFSGGNINFVDCSEVTPTVHEEVVSRTTGLKAGLEHASTSW